MTQEEPTARASVILRPIMRFGLFLCGILFVVQVVSGIGGRMFETFTGIVYLIEVIVGLGLTLYVFLTPGRKSPLRQWAFLLTGGLLAVVLSHRGLFTLARAPLTPVLGIDTTIVLPLLGAIWGAIIGMLLGYFCYLLDGDIPVGPKSKYEQEVSKVILFIIIAVLVIGPIQSVPLQDFLNLQHEAMPRFVARTSTNDAIILQNIPLDGRVVRVGLVLLKDSEMLPAPSETFPVPGTVTYKLFSPNYTPNDFSHLLRNDEFCRGEIWLSAINGKIGAWESLPNGCLEVASIGDSQARFKVRTECRQSAAIYRFIAIVYNTTRSPYVRQRAERVACAECIQYRKNWE